MLQDRPVAPPLGTAAHLGFADQYVVRRSSLKTEKRFVSGLDFVGGSAQPGRDTKAPEGFDQAAVDGPVKLVTAGGQRMGGWQEDAVGQLGIVQDRAATGQPSYNRATADWEDAPCDRRRSGSSPSERVGSLQP